MPASADTTVKLWRPDAALLDAAWGSEATGKAGYGVEAISTLAVSLFLALGNIGDRIERLQHPKITKGRAWRQECKMILDVVDDAPHYACRITQKRCMQLSSWMGQPTGAC